jgi:NADH:ubiquinone oxidoreductase subunit F (NADH-binding)
MTGRCKCPICNAPDDEEEPGCFKCNRDLVNQEPHEDAKGNPICEDCWWKAEAEAKCEGDR